MPGASMSSGSDAYHDLCCYTLAHGGAEFIHQHVVDAFGAQEASANDRPIRLVFSLIGLYLHVERGFTGREVQLAHMKLGQRKQVWPVLAIPEQPGAVTAVEVCAAPLSDRDSMIHKWCHSVWQAFAAHREVIEHLLADHGITDSRSSGSTPDRESDSGGTSNHHRQVGDAPWTHMTHRVTMMDSGPAWHPASVCRMHGIEITANYCSIDMQETHPPHSCQFVRRRGTHSYELRFDHPTE